MTASISTQDVAREDLVKAAYDDARVAEALAAFQRARALVPPPAVHFAPVRYSTGTNH